MSKQRIYLNSSEFKPMDELILVKPESLKNEEVSESGIVIAINQNQSVIDRPTSGVVIDFGEAVKSVNLNDMIIWPGTDGIDLEFNDGEFLLLREESIIGTKKDK